MIELALRQGGGERTLALIYRAGARSVSEGPAADKVARGRGALRLDLGPLAR